METNFDARVYRLGLLALLLAAATAHADPIGKLDELKQRALSGDPREQAYNCAQVVSGLVEVANQQFAQGNYEAAQSSVQEIEKYADMAGTASRSSRKKLKEAEIALREAARRLEDLGRSLSMIDRPPVQKAASRLHDVESELLSRLFSR